MPATYSVRASDKSVSIAETYPPRPASAPSAPVSSSIRSMMPPVSRATSDGAARPSYAAFTSSNAESISAAASASIEPRISPNMTPARHTNAEPSWNSAISVIRPPSTASPYSAIDVSRRPFMSFSRNLGSDARSSPTTAVRADSTTFLASSSARCASHTETLCEAADSPSPSSVSNTSASRSGSAPAIVGFIESYSSAIGWVACTRARSAFMSSRFRSSAQKCPSVSSRPAAKSRRSAYDAAICSSSASKMPPVRDATAEGSARRSYALPTASNMSSIRSAASLSMSPRISPSMTPARHTNAEPSWNSAISVIRPPSTASPYSAIDVSRRPFMSFMRKIGSDARPSPTTAVLAASMTPFASSMARCACSRETSVVARDFSPSSVPSMSLSRAGSLSTSVGFIESYSSAIGWVACTRASSALPSSRFCSSAQKCPSASSSPAAKSTLSRRSDSTAPAPFANAAGSATVAAAIVRTRPATATLLAPALTGRRPDFRLIRGVLETRLCYTLL